MEEVSAAGGLLGARRPARLLRLAGDERLVALVRAGDERAFEALYDRHVPPILGFCRHMLGSREEAEDAVQQTFLSAYRDLVGSRKTIQVRPWLFTIARNRCLSMLRARHEHAALETAEPSTEGLASTVERREDVRELLADLARLPEEQRAALLLSELGALDHAGIAAVLGCRREQVKALVFQARSSLAADRQARATPCDDVRAQLATATGATLRRAALRRHLNVCSGCRVFKAEVAHQRRMLAVALPVVPTALLKAGALPSSAAAASAGAAATGAAAGAAAVGTTGAGAGAIAAGGGLLAAGTTTVTKVVLAVTVAGAVAGGGTLTARTLGEGSGQGAQRSPAAAQTSPASTPMPPGALPGGSGPSKPAIRSAPRQLTAPPRSAEARGFTPELQPGAGGNGAAARSFARTRGARGADAPAHQTSTSRGHGSTPRVRSTQPARGRSDARPPAGGKRADVVPSGSAKAPAPADKTPTRSARKDAMPAGDAIDGKPTPAKRPVTPPPAESETTGG